MVQSKVLVTYAPVGHSPVGGRRYFGKWPQRRWGAMATGAVMAGGAVFVLGQFVAPDGSPRPAITPQRPAPPALATAAPAPAPAEDPWRSEAPPQPHLAPARDLPDRAPAPARATMPARSDAVPVKLMATPPRAWVAAAAAELELAPAPPPVAVERRDVLDLSEQRPLAPPAPSPADAEVGPVTEWRSSDLALVAAADGDSPARTPTLELTEADIAPPELEPGSAEASIDIILPEDASPQLVEATQAELTGPTTVAEAERMDAIPSQPNLAFARVGKTVETGESAPIDPAPTVAASAADIKATPAPHYVQSFPMAVVDGEPIGAVTFRDLGDAGQAIHLGALLGLMRLRMPQTEFARLSGATAASQFVTLDRLRAAGITVQFDARRQQLLIDAR